ncbi:hypothetical protein BH11PLA2_BH11PLA2_28330 [soil metagenome]
MADPFLNAILAAPDDDTPRLVYADWLEEQGDAERAEFIRTQIEFARSPRPELEQRADELLHKHRERWIIPGISGVQTFHRGFVDSLRMAAADFVAHADRIGETAPVVDLRLPMALEHIDAIAQVPWLSRIERLDLTGNVGITGILGELVGAFQRSEASTLPARVVGTLFDANILGRLRSLVLRNNQFWPTDVATLERIARGLPKLERLNLSGNPIGDGGVETLAASTAFANLKELVLRCDELQYIDSIHAIGAAAIANSKTLGKLRHLDLNGHYIGSAGFVDLVESKTLHNLETLDVSYNEIGVHGDEAYERFAESRQLQKLKRLVLDGNRISVIALQTLLQSPRLAAVDCISVKDCFEDDLPARILEDHHAQFKFEYDHPSAMA